jgi:hypothetical protein
MTSTTLKRSLATAAAIAAGTLAIAAPAGAHDRDPRGFLVDVPCSVDAPVSRAAEPARAPASGAIEQPAAGADGIIAILIGLAQAQPFTPPIGTDKGSFAGTGWRLDGR